MISEIQLETVLRDDEARVEHHKKLLDLVLDEVNVKEYVFGQRMYIDESTGVKHFLSYKRVDRKFYLGSRVIR